MSSLSPCPSCHRHAKRSDAMCPFCGAALANEARQVKLPRGAKRAVLFAIGLGAATSGCDTFAEPIDSDSSDFAGQPVYGAVVPPPKGTLPTGGNTVVPGTTGPTTTAPGQGVPSGPPSPTDTAPMDTAPMDIGPMDALPSSSSAGPSDSSPEPTASASSGANTGDGFTSDAGTAADAGSRLDAGGQGAGGVANDAGVDSAAPDAAPADSAQGGVTEMPGPVPPYGAPPQPIYGAPPASL